MTIRTFAVIALGLAASPAFADAVIYKGTVAGLSVVMELSEDPQSATAELFGRYFYEKEGVDIPLHAVSASRSGLGLVEEVACDEKLNNCPRAQDDPPTDPPLGATWELTIGRTGHLEGKWTNNGRNQPVRLQRIATRPFDPTEGLQGFSSFASSMFYEGTTLTAETSPYDFLKMADYVRDQAGTVELIGGTVRYLVDERTKFQFPRIVDIDGMNDVPANEFLEQRHWMMSLDALWCVAQKFQGFGWNGYNYDAGTLGWWDEEQVEVHYLSPYLMSWTEGGSLSCGGAHPYNHYEFHNLDVATGMPLDLSRIFKGWVARTFDGKLVDLETARANPRDYQWGPDDALLAFVNEHRPSNEELGFTGDLSDCPINEMIPEYLAIGFKGENVVRFSMDGMPHVSSACATDLYEAPIAELKELLAPEAAEYFLSLGL